MYKSDESGSVQERKEHLAHLAASLQEAKNSGGATLLVGAGISISAGIPSAQFLIEKAVEKYPNFFTSEEKNNPADMQYNHAMQKLSNVHRKELFKPYIGSAKLNFAHIAIAELLKQGFISRILTVNFDPLLIHACYMVGMYPFPAIYDLGAVSSLNAELLNNPCIVYLNGQHVGFVQRNTPDQFETHVDVLNQIVRSTGCTNTWIVAGYSGENDPLMTALANLRPYNNWLYWLEYSEQLCQSAEGKTKDTHQFLEQDEECKVIYGCDADETFMEIAASLGCDLDFIEQPEKELKRYSQTINFDTAGKKTKFYLKILNAHIKSLSKSSEVAAISKNLIIYSVMYAFSSKKDVEATEDLLDKYLDVYEHLELEYYELQELARLIFKYNELQEDVYTAINLEFIERLLKDAFDKCEIKSIREDIFYRLKSLQRTRKWLTNSELQEFKDSTQVH